MKGYSTADISTMLGISPSRIRSWVRAGFLQPEKGDRGEYRFSFPDLVLLRTTQELLRKKIPARKVRRALGRLRDQLPAGHPLTALRIGARGDDIVVQGDGALWHADSGQLLFDFSVADLAVQAAPVAARAAEEAVARENDLTVDEWFDLAYELEFTDPERAVSVYRRILRLSPDHADVHVNLGRLLQEEGKGDEAAQHYRAALEADPDHVIAAFNLGVVMEDLGRTSDARRAYEQALAIDPDFIDALYNLGCLLQEIGEPAEALRCFQKYRKLTRAE